MSGPYHPSDLWPTQHKHDDTCEECDACSETPGRSYNNADVTSGQWDACDVCGGRGCNPIQDREFSKEQESIIERLKSNEGA